MTQGPVFRWQPERSPSAPVRRRVASGALAILGLAACSSDDGGPTQPALTTGDLTVSIETTGSSPPSGYTVAVDGETPITIGANGSTSLSGVGPGERSVRLDGVPGNCAVAGSNPRVVTVTAGRTTSVPFQVDCVEPTGAIEVTATTTGSDIDPDGYVVSVDGAGERSIGVDETLSPTELPVGDHEVELAGLADNCDVTGANPRTVTVTLDETVATTFRVTCGPPTDPPDGGAIELTTTTTGIDPDPDGYFVRLDDRDPEPIGTDDSVTFDGLAEGAHAVLLTGVAENCGVQGPNPASVDVTPDATIGHAVTVECGEGSNGSPDATISSPDTTRSNPPLRVAPGTPVTFGGQATDPEDGPLTGPALTWRSNVDGEIGTGEMFTTGALSEGQHTVTLSAMDDDGAVGTATVLVVVAPPALPGYQITLRLSEGTVLTAAQSAAVDEAVEKLEAVVVGDLPDVPFASSAFQCGARIPTTDETIDDVIIYLAVEPIDGQGGILGAAGPCILRDDGSFLPAIGGMIFDEADLATLDAGGFVDELLLHEAIHVMGFGSIWTDLGLVHDLSHPDGPTPGADTYFDGPEAVARFLDVGGDDYAGGNIVPVENDTATYGSGSLDGHWRESALDAELMTPSLNTGVTINPLSRVTVGQFQDLGYTVDLEAADPYQLDFAPQAVLPGETRTLRLEGDILRGPLWLLDRDGRKRRIR